MFKSYLKIALRNLQRQKIYTILNITGLSVGMTASFLVLLFVYGELSYDNFHEKGDRVFRVIANDQIFKSSEPDAPFLFAPTVESEFPEVRKAARVRRVDARIKIGDGFSRMGSFVCSDSEIFDILTLPVLQGDPGTLLVDPYAVTISEEMAKVLFGDENPVGKTLTVNNYGEVYELKVTGIFKDLPHNSTFRANFIAGLKLAYDQLNKIYSEAKILPNENWEVASYMTYLQLVDGSQKAEFEKKLADFVTNRQKEPRFKYHLQPLKDIYLGSAYLTNNHVPQGDTKKIYLFSAVALLILLIAAISFVLLSTALSARRTTEVGLRKVVGARRADVIWQILLESIALAMLALPVALVALELALPQLNQMFGLQLATRYLRDWPMLLGFAGITLVVGLLSGSYIAILVSALHPVEILRRKSQGMNRRSLFRRALIIVQISIFTALIGFSVTIQQQLHFVQTQDMGFDKEHLLTISFRDREVRESYQAYKDAVKSHAGVIDVSGALYVPPTDGFAISQFPKADEPETKIEVECISVDYDFEETLGLEVVAGRSFSKDYATDLGNAVIINETAVRELGMDDPVGKLLGEDMRVIGVVKDFHIHSFRKKIKPVALDLQPKYAREMIIKISPVNISGTIAFLRDRWENLNPGKSFKYRFFDESLQSLYSREQQFSKIMRYFTLLAIFVACLGLLGLALFMAEQKTKEIGIRKVLGASMPGIVGLLSKEFCGLILIGAVVASPFAYYAMNRWLQNFAYRISIEWWVFVLAGGLALAIALLTVSTQAIRAALANPVESLRCE
ncbi:MAG: ABC transporter permease [bacterium]